MSQPVWLNSPPILQYNPPQWLLAYLLSSLSLVCEHVEILCGAPVQRWFVVHLHILKPQTLLWLCSFCFLFYNIMPMNFRQFFHFQHYCCLLLCYQLIIVLLLFCFKTAIRFWIINTFHVISFDVSFYTLSKEQSMTYHSRFRVMMFEDKANSPACKPDGPPPKRDIASLP